MLRVRTRDDRGRLVRVVRFCALRSPGDSRVGAACRALVSGLISKPGRWIAALALLAVLLIGLTAVFGPQVIAIAMFSPVSSSIIVLVSLAGVAGVSWYRERAESVKRDMIRAARCPACAYPIGGIEPETDACTTCPECGAAWRLSDARYERGSRVLVVGADGNVIGERSPGSKSSPPTMVRATRTREGS